MYIILRKKTEFNRYLSRLNYTKTPETRKTNSTICLHLKQGEVATRSVDGGVLNKL